MEITGDNMEHLGRGILWFIGTATGAYWCWDESKKNRRALLLFMCFVCICGALFNIYVMYSALSDIF